MDRFIKGEITTAHSAIAATATSTDIKCKGFNAVIAEITITGTGTWKIDVQGRMDNNSASINLYDNNDNQLTTGNLTASRTKLFVAVTDFIRIVATEVDGTATCTVKIQPVIV
jgi:hypothetical protein